MLQAINLVIPDLNYPMGRPEHAKLQEAFPEFKVEHLTNAGDYNIIWSFTDNCDYTIHILRITVTPAAHQSLKMSC